MLLLYLIIIHFGIIRNFKVLYLKIKLLFTDEVAYYKSPNYFKMVFSFKKI